MYKKILVPVDGSPTSNRGLAEAIKLAAAMGAQLRLIHFVDPYAYVGGFESPAVFITDLLPLLREGGQTILKECQAQAVAAGVQSETVLVDDGVGRLSDFVVSQALSWPADLIVIGTHGRRGVRRVFLGSDAEQVLRVAPVPVLLVRGVDEGVEDGKKTV
jgi:nucleotide-binding universal stress UspA family protein